MVFIRRWFESVVGVVDIGQKRDERHGFVDLGSELPVFVITFFFQNVKFVSKSESKISIDEFEKTYD